MTSGVRARLRTSFEPAQSVAPARQILIAIECQYVGTRAHSQPRHPRQLVCEIIAVMTLRAIGQEAWSLATGIEKLLRFNHSHFGGEIDVLSIPPSCRCVSAVQFPRGSRGACLLNCQGDGTEAGGSLVP